MSDATLIDFEWRAIQIAEVRDDGFVSFDFYVGDPDIYAEMILPKEAFNEFCATHGVEPIGPEERVGSADGLGFSLRDAAAHAADSARTSIPNRGHNHAA